MVEHFTLTWRELRQARADFRKLGLLLPESAALLDRGVNGRKEFFVIHRLGEEITRAAFHRLNALRNITHAGKKNDRQETTCLRKNILKLKTVYGRHCEIQHDTAQYAGIVLRQELSR